MSDVRLAGCMPEFVGRLEQAQAAALARGVTIRWTAGLRTWDEQTALYRRGRDVTGRIVDPRQVVTFAPAGSSWHNFGLAGDFVLVMLDGRGVDWSGVADLDRDGIVDWLEVGQCGEACGLTWGGRWPKLNDMPHLEWSGGLALADARRLYLESGPPRTLAAVWDAVRRRAAGGGP